MSDLRYSYSTIAPETLMARVLPDYAIDAPLECLFWGRGANDTYMVRTAKERYFLRVCRTGAFSREALEFEANALTYLHRQGVPVAYPIARRSGGYLTEIAASEGPRFILLTALALGGVPDYDDARTCRLVGASVAQFHALSAGFETSHTRPRLDLDWLVDDSINVIRAHVSHRSDVLRLYEKGADAVRAAMEGVPDHAMDQGLCHGDLHGGNLHLHDGTVTFFDFEECAFGYRVYDLATFKWGVCPGKKMAAHWSAFQEGYSAVLPLSDRDASLIDPFLIARELAETAYGIRHVQYFGRNAILAADADYACDRLKRLLDGVRV